MTARLLNLFILFMMGLNGACYRAWFLSPPNPDRIGFWFGIYFFIFPILGVTGMLSLVSSDSLKTSKWIGRLLLLYVGLLTLLANSYSLGFAWALALFPVGSVEVFHFILFIATLWGLILVMQRRARVNS